MKITLFQLSSYYLIILLFPLFYRVQMLRNYFIPPESSGFVANYQAKNWIILILVFTNAGMLVLRATLETTKLIDPIYFVMQLVMLTNLALENCKEKELGLRSPWYTFPLYFASNVIYLLFCNLFYLIFGENCDNYSCGSNNMAQQCYSCRIFPMVAGDLTVYSGNSIVHYSTTYETQLALWCFIEFTLVISIVGCFVECSTKKKLHQEIMLNNSSGDQLELF